MSRPAIGSDLDDALIPKYALAAIMTAPAAPNKIFFIVFSSPQHAGLLDVLSLMQAVGHLPLRT
jgi:hypothetical protein